MPLWSGNQHLRRDEENPTYGTAMVIRELFVLGETTLAAGGIARLLPPLNPGSKCGERAGGKANS